MKKIYLFCSAGMSTSMLARKMQKAADEHKLAVRVDAFSSSKIADLVEGDRPDVILLGPQVGFMLDDVAGKYGAETPVAVIDPDDYGALDGERVLKYAILLLKKHQAN